jgi:hypothetical protein
MKKIFLSILYCTAFVPVSAQDMDSAYIKMIYNKALREQQAYGWLEELCLDIGHRLSGSPQAERAVKWADSLMRALKFNVYRQECMVPFWSRGPKEQAWIVTRDNKIEVPILALGGSVATPPEGIKAKIVEVKSFDELDVLGKTGQVRGKIVFFNKIMDPAYINPFEAYGEAVRYRWEGAMRAARHGAAAVVVRSMTTAIDDFPHTGSMGYNDTTLKIPACAISTRAAETLSKFRIGNPDLEFHFIQQPKSGPDVKSYNVIGEIKGTEKPDEIIVVGGHLDSWDVGHGAHDNGTGCVQAIEALHLLKSLNIPLKRTVRVVMFMNEENGGRGGAKFAELARKNKEKIIAAIESDAGGHTPRGFSFKGDARKIEKAMRFRNYFTPYLADLWGPGYGGADINHLEDLGTLLIGFRPDSQRYFDYHHSQNDTFDKVHPRELALGSASMAALIYLLSQYGVE